MKINKKILPIVFLATFFFGCVSTPTEKSPKVEEKKEIKENKKVEQKDPPNIQFAKKLQDFLQKNDIKNAISCFETIPESLKDDLDLKILLASLYYSDFQYDNAIFISQQILEVQSGNITALEIISLCQKAKGDKKAYNLTIEKILEKDPYNSSVNIQKAQDYAISKKFKQAKNSYNNALKNDKNNTEALFGFAQMSYFTGDLDESQNTLEKVLELEPENDQALSYLAKISYENGKLLRATNFIQQAIKINPVNYDYYLDLGTYLVYQNKNELANDAWKKATELDPTYFLAYAYLAGNYDEMEEFDKALLNYHKVIETNPKYYFAYESAAILEYHQKNYKNAILLFQKAYNYSDSWAYTLMIASCYFKMNDMINAKKVLAAQLKRLNNESTEYALVRLFHDSYSKNAEASLKLKIEKESNRTVRGKMLFYMGLYYEINKADILAEEYYAKVTGMKSPTFFEYRIAQWGLQK